ncbi:MAG: hypothetical protein IID61_17760 [SAR324 cluster bacterium]|nr:hypothetical protein [SAR324 cluster bacterium]
MRGALKRLAANEADVEAFFGQVQMMSEDEGILSQIESGIVEMVKRGVIAMTDSMRGIVEPFRDVQKKRAVTREAANREFRDAADAEPGAAAQAPGKILLEKDTGTAASLDECFPVETDKQGYRGGGGKTIYKDYVDTARVFQNNELAIYRFKHCFNILLHHFRTSQKENPVVALRHPHPTEQGKTFDEHYLALQLPEIGTNDLHKQPLMLCLGTTHFPRKHLELAFDGEAEDPADALVDPYVILFVGSTTAQGAGRAVSRKIDGKGHTFNEVRILDTILPLVYQALHLVLHHLPDDDRHWNHDDVQWCVDFLRKTTLGK